jgi:hypothetical protein
LNEGGIPHKKTPVERRFYKIADEKLVDRRGRDVTEGGFPRVIIAFDVVLMSVKNGLWQTVTDLFVGRDPLFFLLHTDKRVLGNVAGFVKGLIGEISLMHIALHGFVSFSQKIDNVLVFLLLFVKKGGCLCLKDSRRRFIC